VDIVSVCVAGKRMKENKKKKNERRESMPFLLRNVTRVGRQNSDPRQEGCGGKRNVKDTIAAQGESSVRPYP